MKIKTLHSEGIIQGSNLAVKRTPALVLTATMSILEMRARVEPYRAADNYIAELEDVELFLGKYFINKSNEMIHGGLTYNDYTIVHPEIDRHGFADGIEIVRSGILPQRYYDLRDQSHQVIDESAIWINGQTTPEPFFGHWLHEHLAKIYYCLESNLDVSVLAVRDSIPERFHDWILALYPEVSRVVRVPSVGVKFKRLTVPSAVNYRSRYGLKLCVGQNGLFDLRRRGRKAVKIRPLDKGDRKRRALYIPRSSEWRRLVNEREIVKIIGEHFDVTEFVLSDRGPIEQISQVLGYDLIFGASGSSMPITMFADQGTVVLEFFNPKNEGKWAAKVYCDLFGMPHVRIEGEIVSENRGPTPSDQDYMVNQASVRGALKQIDHYLNEIDQSNPFHDFNGRNPTIIPCYGTYLE